MKIFPPSAAHEEATLLGSATRSSLAPEVARPSEATSGFGRLRARRAFSLIEMVGVMAVIAVIAAAVLPTFIQRLDYAAKTEERERLRAFTNGLVQVCLRDRHIPISSSMPGLLASYLAYAPIQVTNNARGFARAFLVDPAFNIDGVSDYTQAPNGATNPPVNGRVIILSTVAKALPSLTSLNASDFDTLWNAPENSVPSPLASWGGRGEDLVLERVELGPLFHKVVLVNVDPSPNIGRFGVNSGSNTWVNSMPYVASATGAAASKFRAYYMDGTVLQFYKNNLSLDTREIVHTDLSYVYQNDRWGRRLGGSDDVIGSFGQLVADFLKPPAPADPKFAATQQAVVNEFYSYLYGFSVWAYGDPRTVTNKAGTAISPAVPPFAGAGGPGAPNYPSYSAAAEAQVHMANFTDNVIH